MDIKHKIIDLIDFQYPSLPVNNETEELFMNAVNCRKTTLLKTPKQSSISKPLSLKTPKQSIPKPLSLKTPKHSIPKPLSLKTLKQSIPKIKSPLKSPIKKPKTYIKPKKKQPKEQCAYPAKPKTLRDFGYSSKLQEKERQDILKKITKKIGKQKTLKKLNLLINLHKNENPHVAGIFKCDTSYVNTLK